MRYSQTLRIIGPEKYAVMSDWNIDRVCVFSVSLLDNNVNWILILLYDLITYYPIERKLQYKKLS